MGTSDKNRIALQAFRYGLLNKKPLEWDVENESEKLWLEFYRAGRTAVTRLGTDGVRRSLDAQTIIQTQEQQKAEYKNMVEVLRLNGEKDLRREPCQHCDFIVLCRDARMLCGMFRYYTEKMGKKNTQITVPDETLEHRSMLDKVGEMRSELRIRYTKEVKRLMKVDAAARRLMVAAPTDADAAMETLCQAIRDD